MNWGVLGLGLIAKEFAQVVPVYACAARNKERAEAFKETYGCQKAYGSYDALLADPNVDAVYIAVVNSAHIELIEKSILARKHVLCEKALTTNLEEYERMLSLAKENQVYLMEAMTVYHMPLYKKLKEEVQKGSIGKIKFVEAELGSLKEDTSASHFFKPELGGGAMADIGTYVLSMVCYFLQGKVSEYKQTHVNYPSGVDEMWNMALVTDQDEIGSANCTYRCKLPKRAIIGGEKGYYEIYDYPRGTKATLVLPDGTKTVTETGESSKALAYEASALEEAITTKNESLLHIEDTKTVISLMDAFLKEAELPRF